MAGHRLEHLNEAIRQKLGTILIEEAKDPRFKLVTITRVGLAKDLSFARVEFCVFEPGIEISELTDSLNHAAGFFSYTLSRSLSTRQTPKLQFYYDNGFDYAQEIETLLAQVQPREEP